VRPLGLLSIPHNEYCEGRFDRFPTMTRAGRSTVFAFGFLLIGAMAFAAAEAARGQALYLRYCGSCHGISADGHGPVASALKTPPADLRILSKRYGNPLPEDQIAQFIDGRADVQAHGPRDMPIWGERIWAYGEAGGQQRKVSPRIADLVAYLQSIQKTQLQARLEQSLGRLERRVNR